MTGLRQFWEPPLHPETLNARVLRAYRRKVARRRRTLRTWIPLAAALAGAALGTIAGVRIQTRFHPPQRGIYVPVRQPKVIVIGEGERP
ncbi:MAG: hypothetical protein WBY44_12760 [Bryobacteraceae bacterium]